MNVKLLPFGVQEVTFDEALGIDKVHAEALCALLRPMESLVSLASHSTEHGKLYVRIRPVEVGTDVRGLLQQAAAQRVAQFEQLLAATPV